MVVNTAEGLVVANTTEAVVCVAVVGSRPSTDYRCLVQACGFERQCVWNNGGLTRTSAFIAMTRPPQVCVTANKLQPCCISYCWISE